MNLVIKVGNLQYLALIQQLLYSKVQLKADTINIVKLPYYNFIQLLIQIFTQYTKNSHHNIHDFILSYFINRYETAYQLYRHMYGCITMWKKYLESQQESRILLSLLSVQRNSKESVRLFLRIRKEILKNTNNTKIMQEILLTHQDIIAISHNIFSKDMKAYVAKKIKQLFISIKKKSLYSNNKVNGAVICEFFMNCAEKFEKQQLDNIRQYYENAPEQEKQMEAQIMKKRTFNPLNTQCDVEYLQALERLQHIQETVQNQPVIPQVQSFPHKKPKNSRSNQKFIINNIYDNQPQKRNDKRNEAQRNGNDNEQALENDIINRKYSYSWQKFLRTNQQMKQKLLKGHS